jgi:aldose 1-epimerase
VRIVELSSETLQVGVLDHGARLAHVRVPDRSGAFADISLGYDTEEGWLADKDFLGATIGRFANRIADGRFTLDGVNYTIPPNENANALHGGPRAFDHADFTFSDVAVTDDGGSVVASLVSPDGENGFPGTLSMTVTVTVAGSDLSLEFRATTDAPTVVNLTNHAYWNLSGRAATVDDQLITVAADGYLPVTETLVPTGEVAAVAGSMDLRAGVRFGDVLRRPTAQMLLTQGIDHCYVLNESAAGAPRFAARVEDPGSGRVLELHTDQPAVQVYSGNFLDGSVVLRGGTTARQGDAFCLEPQGFPDAPNQPQFPSTVLRPGQQYRHTSLFRFATSA